jgi:hypothetical protein
MWHIAWMNPQCRQNALLNETSNKFSDLIPGLFNSCLCARVERLPASLEGLSSMDVVQEL